MAKALRFYQRAFAHYHAATAMQNAPADSYYNALRLLYHVYTHYTRVDAVDYGALANVAEVLTNDDRSVVQDITAIVHAHELALAVAHDTDGRADLLYNAVLAYTDLIEDADDAAALRAGARAAELVRELIQMQLLPQTEAESQELRESIAAAFKLAQSVVESCPGQAAPLVQEVAQYQTAYGAVLSEDGSGECAVAYAYLQALTAPDWALLYLVWDGPLPETPERYMLAADSIETVLTARGTNALADADPETYWAALTKMNAYYKQAQDVLAADYQRKTKLGELGVGSLISQLAKVHIARSDVDLQRSQLPTEQARSHAQVLVNNAKAFLKNAMNLAKASGGIRETQVEKLERERRRIEAVLRLAVLEGKTPDEMNAIMGPGRWEADVREYADLWYFPSSG